VTMRALSTVDRRTLPSRLALFVVLGLMLTGAAIAQDGVDESPTIQEICRGNENTVTDLKGFREQNKNGSLQPV
jgi:hypothetical protein